MNEIPGDGTMADAEKTELQTNGDVIVQDPVTAQVPSDEESDEEAGDMLQTVMLVKKDSGMGGGNISSGEGGENLEEARVREESETGDMEDKDEMQDDSGGLRDCEGVQKERKNNDFGRVEVEVKAEGGKLNEDESEEKLKEKDVQEEKLKGEEEESEEMEMEKEAEVENLKDDEEKSKEENEEVSKEEHVEVKIEEGAEVDKVKEEDDDEKKLNEEEEGEVLHEGKLKEEELEDENGEELKEGEDEEVEVETEEEKLKEGEDKEEVEVEIEGERLKEEDGGFDEDEEEEEELNEDESEEEFDEIENYSEGESGDEMFEDDVNNLYAAYQSVLATDNTDLDPLDTSVLEDPHADLPPITEDDELGTGEFSETMMTQSTGEHSGFGDSNLQTVMPLPTMKPKMMSSGSEMGTDELICKRIGFDSLDFHKSVGDSQNEDMGTGELLKTPLDVVEVDTVDAQMAEEEAKILMPETEEAKIGGASEGMISTETNLEEGQIEATPSQEEQTESKSPSQECSSDVKEVTRGATLQLPDVATWAVSAEGSRSEEDRETDSKKNSQTTQDPVIQEVKVATVTETIPPDQKATENSSDETATVEAGIATERQSNVMPVTDTVHAEQAPVTEVTPSVSAGHFDVTDVAENANDNEIEATQHEQGVTGVTPKTVTGVTLKSVTGLTPIDSETVSVKCNNPEIAASGITEPLASSKCQDVHSEAKYDSGCETERSEEAGLVHSIDDEAVNTSSEAVAEDPVDDDSLPSKEYPDFINTCEEKLRVHYVSCYAKEAPIDWFHVPSKPTHRIFTNINLVEKNGKRREQHLTFDQLTFDPSLRILIEGRAGMGKSTLVHRIAYDYGLGIMCPLKRFKLVFVLDVLKWSRDQEVHDVILEQVVQADAWGVDPKNLFDWMENNPEDVAFVIDGLDEHPGFPSEHTLLSLAQGELYTNSTVIFTTQPSRVVEITDSCHKSYVMQKFTEKQVDEFVDNFIEDKNIERDKLKVTLSCDKGFSEFYKVPLHLATICTLVQNDEILPTDPLPTSLTELFNKVFVYILRQLVADRRVDSQKELELSMFEDMAFVLTRLALSCLQDDIVSLSKSQLSSEHEIDDDLLEQFIHYGLLEKVVCRDAYFFPYKLFQEFLAAKFIAIEYFSAANSGQIGVIQDMKHVTELFDLCWACYVEGYKYENLCIFTSGLLTQDYNLFIEALRKQYTQAPDDTARDLCLNVACACISENAKNRGFISLVVDSLAPKGDLKLDFSQDNVDGPCLLGLSHMISADKLPKLSLVNYNPSDQNALISVANSIAETIRLRSLEIDFTNLDPTVFGIPKTKDAEDFSILKQFVKSISLNSSIRDLGFRLNVDVMCLQGVEIISGLFLNALGDVRSLSVHVYFKNKSTYFQDCPVIKENIQSYENLNLLVSRFAVFLQNNPMLEKLELNGCFLHKDALPELKNKIIRHPYLKAFSIAGQKEGAPLHREGTNALAEILHYRNFEEVSIDLNSFLPKKLDKYNLRDGYVLFDKIEFENELIIAKLLRAMQGNGNLKCVKFSFHQIDCDLLDHMADFVEECVSLKRLEISCEDMDDLFMLFLGCGILCSATLENLTLHGNFHSGGATFLLLQSCIMSLSLRTVTLAGSFTQDCIDWLAVSLPNLNIHSTHPMTLTFQGHLEDTDPDSVLESVEQLKDCVLPLDLLLETDFK